MEVQLLILQRIISKLKQEVDRPIYYHNLASIIEDSIKEEAKENEEIDEMMKNKDN